MTPRLITSTLILIIGSASLLTGTFGCSGNMNQALSPEIQDSLDNRPVANPGIQAIEDLPSIPGPQSHNMTGFWTVAINPDTLEAEIVASREGMYHFNVTKFVDGPPLSLGIAINKPESDPLNGLIDCMITLTNPFAPTLTNLCGFDVRGILFTQGGSTIGGLKIASPSETRLLNADGHTRWWNPTEFPGTGLLAFTPGAAAPSDYSALTATLNPYKYFSDALNPDDPVSKVLGTTVPAAEKRGIFKPGESNTRRYRIQFPSTGSGLSLVFNYGVDISWVAPTVKPPVNLPNDFPNAANSIEPFLIEVDITCNTLWFTGNSDRGGELFLNIRISDWQGKVTDKIADEISQLRVQCPGVFAGTLTADFRWEDRDYAHYVVDVGDYGIPTGAGTFPLLVSAISTTGEYNQGFPTAFPSGPVTAYKLIYVTVKPAATQPFTLPYADDMGPNTRAFWTVENGPGHAPPGGSKWHYATDHWGVSDSLTDTYEQQMDTYLVSPRLVVPVTGVLTVRYLRAMKAGSTTSTAGGNVVYRINAGLWKDMSPFFSSAYDTSTSDPAPMVGQIAALKGLTSGDNIEIGFHFKSDNGIPQGFGYHIYRVVVQEGEAAKVNRVDYPQFLSNSGTSYSYQVSTMNATTYPMHRLWWGVDWFDSSLFMNTYGGNAQTVNFPTEGKFWVGLNAYIRTPVEWLVSGVGADVDVISFAKTPGAFFQDEFTDNAALWDLTGGADVNGNFMQIRGDGSGWLDNRQGESGAYAEEYNGTPTPLPEKSAKVNMPIPGTPNDGTKTYIRMIHRFWMYPLDGVEVRVNGTQVPTIFAMHYQSFNSYLGRYTWGWFDPLNCPRLEAVESILLLGDAYNGTLIDLELVTAVSNDFPNKYSDFYTFGWQVDYIEMFQIPATGLVFEDDFNRGFIYGSEGYTYPFDLTHGADLNGNFWNVVPDQEGGYLTNVQLATGCWNGSTAPEITSKAARMAIYFPHTFNNVEITISHRFNTESEGEVMYMQVNGVNVPPDSGFIYNGSGDYWTGNSGGWVTTHWTLPPHSAPGGLEEVKFISKSADATDNCTASGYSGWQIDWINIKG